MIRRVRMALLPGFAAAAALFIGLAPSLIDHGRFEPLDWLVPGYLALAAMTLFAGAEVGASRRALHWTLVVWPPMLVMALAASVMPWPGIALLVVLLATAAFLLGRGRRWRWMFAAIGLLAMIGMRVAVPALEGSYPATPRVAVMTALPLFAQERGKGDVLHGVGMRAPVVRGLEAAVPVDALNAKTLGGFERLLLAQPRLLSPAELVALDTWVREGGRVTILADPLLRWPDERPLADSRRAPLTSLLDPLLTHWGLTLEPAAIDPARPVERRLLSGGALLQLAGASHFTAAQGAPCMLAEQGLIAYCRIGKGKAVLIADADWIDDRLWTQAPERPRDPRGWTSDALPMLSHLIAGEWAPLRPRGAWLVSQDVLVSALRWALGLVVLLALALARFVPLPMSTQDMVRRAGPDPKPPSHDST